MHCAPGHADHASAHWCAAVLTMLVHICVTQWCAHACISCADLCLWACIGFGDRRWSYVRRLLSSNHATCKWRLPPRGKRRSACAACTACSCASHVQVHAMCPYRPGGNTFTSAGAKGASACRMCTGPKSSGQSPTNTLYPGTRPEATYGGSCASSGSCASCAGGEDCAGWEGGARARRGVRVRLRSARLTEPRGGGPRRPTCRRDRRHCGC